MLVNTKAAKMYAIIIVILFGPSFLSGTVAGFITVKPGIWRRIRYDTK